MASLEKEEAAAEAEARDLELEKLKPPPPPAPYFSWAQAAESAGKKIAHLRATALDHDLVERKMVHIHILKSLYCVPLHGKCTLGH